MVPCDQDMDIIIVYTFLFFSFLIRSEVAAGDKTLLGRKPHFYISFLLFFLFFDTRNEQGQGKPFGYIRYFI